MRSENKNGHRYINYLGDGDSASYKTVKDTKPHGPDIEINKLECIGHVQKRCRGRLRKFKPSWKGKKLKNGKTVAGRGGLTDSKIDTLQNFYGLVIRHN